MSTNISALFLTLLVSLGSYGLQPIPLHKLANSTSIKKSPLLSLQSVDKDPRLESCRKDLKSFIANLSASDLKEIQKQQQAFQATKLIPILKAKIANASSYKIEVDDFMDGVSILIPHGNMKCQISIYPKLEMDQLKAHLESTSADVKIADGSQGFFDLEATLVGVSASAVEGSSVHFDPSKAMTILKHLGVLDINEQVKLLEDFQKIESTTNPNSSKNPGIR